jgi:hypothetical protein
MSAAPLRWREDRRRWGRLRPLRLRDKRCCAPQWLALLDAENVQTVILDRYKDRALLRSLHHAPQWIVDFSDRRSVILVRRAAANVVELGNMTS